jgi:hypothetical protein
VFEVQGDAFSLRLSRIRLALLLPSLTILDLLAVPVGD